MQTIAQNNYYELKYDENKNRVYFKIFGFWQSMSEVPNYHSDMEKTAQKTKPGFTMVSDVRQMKTPPNEVGEAHGKAQQRMVKAGLKKTADVVTSSLLNMATRRYAKSSQMPRESFASIEEAERWLDKES